MHLTSVRRFSVVQAAIALLIPLLLFAQQASAISISRDDRYIAAEWHDYSGGDGGADAAGPSQHAGEQWSGNVVSGGYYDFGGLTYQDSLGLGILGSGELGFEASGGGYSYSEYNSPYPSYTDWGQSVFDIALAIDQQTVLSLTSILEVSPGAYPGMVTVEVFAGDNVEALNILYSFGVSELETGAPVNGYVELLLEAGQEYRVVAQVTGWGYSGDAASYDITGVLTTVPIPAAAWLFVSGLGGLSLLRRNRAGC